MFGTISFEYDFMGVNHNGEIISDEIPEADVKVLLTLSLQIAITKKPGDITSMPVENPKTHSKYQLRVKNL